MRPRRHQVDAADEVMEIVKGVSGKTGESPDREYTRAIVLAILVGAAEIRDAILELKPEEPG